MVTDLLIGRFRILGAAHSRETPKSNPCFNSSMCALPIDVALTLAAAGVDFNLSEDELSVAIRSAIAGRGGYHTEPELTDIGYRVELLHPDRVAFEGRTPEMALAWCLFYLMSEHGEIGIRGFQS